MATHLKTKRKELGLSQGELAGRLGMSRPTLVKVENGERSLTPEEEHKLALITDEIHAHSINDVRINVPEKNLKKFEQVLLYVLQEVGARPNVGMTVLYKLLYFIDFDFYEKYEKQLMGLTYIKNTHGPTPREFVSVIKDMEAQGMLEQVKSTYYKHEQKKFLPRVEPDLSVLTGQELEMIDDVLRRYADKSATALSDMTHRDTPWKASKDGENIDYELAFYRPEEFSVREYDEL
jgi:transcriptional regulator with XRE-family HTH domain